MNNDKMYLVFEFHLNSDFKDISEGIRMSVWQEEHDDYLMPGEFVLVEPVKQHYKVKLAVLDPKSFIKKTLIHEKFFFGHPEKVYGFGILKDISTI